jgi:NAD(P)-dependent dehydrogenase (short-subunit alcohol dehydrogenase family)
LDDLTASDLQGVFRTSMFGSFLCCREAARLLSTASGGTGGGTVTLSSAYAVDTDQHGPAPVCADVLEAARAGTGAAHVISAASQAALRGGGERVG